MAYDKHLAAAVADSFREKRERRKALIDKRRIALYTALPEVKALDDEIASISFRLFYKVADGFDPEEAAKTIRDTASELCKKRDDLMTKGGFPRDYLDPPYDCPLCRDEGFVDGGYCTCFKRALTEAVFAESNLATLSGNTFDTFSLDWYSDTATAAEPVSPRKNMERVLDGCKTFADNFNRTNDSLLFTGAPGLGKTFLSSCIANQLIREGISVIYQSAGAVFALLDRLKFSRTPDSDDAYIASRLLDCDLLILDDLGTEFMSEYSVSELFRLVNTRTLSGKKMIVSTNLSLPDLKKLYSDRLVSRFIGNFTIYQFYGKDIRMQKRM